ncbi:MAG TPA: phosphate ABC transporter ATP-binding protein PstB [Dehalococcoidales bacterium]|nr:phosphate ABC transporter ATP-binding protein PstB [Dehalococcoidales bacterium]
MIITQNREESRMAMNLLTIDNFSSRAAEMTPAALEAKKGVLDIQNLNAWYGHTLAVKNVSMNIKEQAITAVIGPSGCGKSTFIRCLNRMHEVVHGGRVSGKVMFDNKDIYAGDADPVAIRRRIGMVFQKPSPFPTMTIFDNVASGLKLTRLFGKPHDLKEIVEKSLRQAALWDEVKDKLHQPGASLSGGQQQRLCIARAIAVEPEVILLDEPCSALDPAATLKIEDLMLHLAKDYTIVIVTHNMQQAARVSDMTAFFLMDTDRAGMMVEYTTTSQIFTNPRDKRTEDYITGRFG